MPCPRSSSLLDDAECHVRGTHNRRYLLSSFVLLVAFLSFGVQRLDCLESCHGLFYVCLLVRIRVETVRPVLGYLRADLHQVGGVIQLAGL